ncbi:MAG: hypothetical protein IPO83_05970 [Chitinophagaceae bacterium]|nr:hypothetical protein [Chitinophagaceae bacterium]
MLKYCSLLLIQCIIPGSLFSQGLSAYLNTRNAFYVFDDSITKEIEYLPPGNFKIGGNCIAYISSDNSFKVYQKGKVIKVNEGFTTEYFMTGNYVVMKNNTSLHVYDNGKSMLLVRNPYDWVASDSLIGFADPLSKAYFIYADGKIVALSQDLIGDPIKISDVGKNILAYTTIDDSLKVFYHGNIYPQPVQNVTEIKTGKNIVAYQNDYNSEFKVFYKGKPLTLETFKVRVFFTGDDLVAYLTTEGKFKIFYEGIVYTIGTFNPGNFRIKDDIVTYTDEVGFFKVFYKGNTYQLEQYTPDHYEMAQHSLYYVGLDGRINFFSFGSKQELPIENYVSLRLDYDVLQVETSPHQFSFYYKGKVF